jgi:ribosomal protein S18 acetylase RimI-like enzyme
MELAAVKTSRDRPLPTLELARSPAHYIELLDLIYRPQPSSTGAHQPYARLDQEAFEAYFLHTGQVFRICQRKLLLGLLWVEARERVLFIHGLIIRPEYRGCGIGAAALQALQEQSLGCYDALELHVHTSNPRARRFYERLGFRPSGYLKGSALNCMRKDLAAPAISPAGQAKQPAG